MDRGSHRLLAPNWLESHQMSVQDHLLCSRSLCRSLEITLLVARRPTGLGRCSEVEDEPRPLEGDPILSRVSGVLCGPQS
jgi:hypothetical protein